MTQTVVTKQTVLSVLHINIRQIWNKLKNVFKKDYIAMDAALSNNDRKAEKYAMNKKEINKSVAHFHSMYNQIR